METSMEDYYNAMQLTYSARRYLCFIDAKLGQILIK